MKRGLQIDWEIADRITYLNLKDWRDYLVKELQEYKEGKTWIHEDDVPRNKKYIKALNRIISAYEPIGD